MISELTDMLTPVTRGELREELAQLESRFENRFSQFDDKLDRLEQRVDDKLAHLEQRVDDKLAHLEQRVDDKLAHLEQSVDNKLDLWGGALLARIAESEKRLVGELARHTQAVYESMNKQLSAFDDKYRDLPERVTRLEVEVEAHALKQR